MGYHMIFELDLTGGRPADLERVDMAGGRLALPGPTFSVVPDEPTISATVYVERDGVGEAVAYGLDSVLVAFASVGEPVAFRSVAVYTEAEFDRVHIGCVTAVSGVRPVEIGRMQTLESGAAGPPLPGSRRWLRRQGSLPGGFQARHRTSA